MKLGAEDTKDGWWWAVMVGPCSGEFLLVFSPDRVAQDIFKPLWAHKTRVFRRELSADLFLPPPAGPVPSPEEGLRPSPPLPTAQAGGDAASGAAALATSGDSSGCAVASSGSTHQEPPQSTQQTRRSETDARDAALAGHEAELQQLIQTKAQGLFNQIFAEVKEELRSGALAAE